VQDIKEDFKFYKYRPFNEHTNDIIITSSMRYSNPSSFNDPFDVSPSYMKKKYTKKERDTFIEMSAKLGKSFNHSDEIREDFIQKYKKECNSNSKFISFGKKINREQFERMGVMCLSKVKDSILMWSHYAENHKGLVFEFDYSCLQKIQANEWPLEIKYEKNNTLISLAPKSHEEMKKQMEIILLTKYSDWAYEKEYRILDQDFQGNKTFEKKLLTKIIFGFKTSKKNMQHMIKLCKQYGFKHVKFEKAEKVEGTFTLRMVPYNAI